MNYMTSRITQGKALVLALALALVAPLASATGPEVPDHTEVVTYVEALFVPIAAIGAAVLLLLLGIKAYKWMRRAT